MAHLQPSRGSTLNSFANGLKVIRAFGPETPAMTLSEAARIVGISRPAARRILLTLVEEGYAEADGRMFRLRPRVLELGYSFIASLGWTNVAQKCMNEVVHLTSTSCNISMLDGEDIVYLFRVPPPAGPVPSLDISIGSRLPAHLSAMGRVMIAALPEPERESYLANAAFHRNTQFTVTGRDEFRKTIESVREHGWSMVCHEHAEGLCSLAVPLEIPGRSVAIGAGWMKTAQRPEELAQIVLPALRAAAVELKLAFGVSGIR